MIRCGEKINSINPLHIFCRTLQLQVTRIFDYIRAVKVFARIQKILIPLLLLIVLGQSAMAQNAITVDQKEALFIVKFFEHIEWPNEKNIPSFTIGVIGDKDNMVYNELVAICDTFKVKGKSVAVRKITSLEETTSVNVLYLNQSSALNKTDVDKAIQGKPILFVTKDYPFGQSMINFIVVNDRLHYEMNEKKCEAAGFKVNIVLTMASIHSEKEWDKLIVKIEDLVNSDEEEVTVNTKDLSRIVNEQKRLLSEIAANTEKLENQKEQLKSQQQELKDKEKMIANAKQEINKQQALIDDQLKKIELQQQNLANLNKNVEAKQAELLAEQMEFKKQHDQLLAEKEKLDAIQEEYATIELKLKEKEILVNEQGKTINEQVEDISQKSSTIEEQKSIIWLSVLFLIIVSVLGGLAYRSYRLKNKANKIILNQKEEIEKQHEILEEQHREITDSINYAKRIQEAILPPLKLVKGYMPDSFILYKPKDIVAGDFYWMEGVNNLIIFAAADCTGHGVPGAMVSVVCHNAMNRAVKEFMLTQPNEILNKTREIVMETFEKSDEDVNDGMDIALCSINTETKKLHFAGANNGLYLVRKGELTEIKPDKQPIGNYQDAKPFTHHELDLQEGDVVYTFSDGYPDQFGGPKGKKFMYKSFRNLLIDIHEKPMNEQHSLLMKTFNDWKGELDQIDDVCIIGVRI